MKAYGLPKQAGDDWTAIRKFGLKSSVIGQRSQGGDFRGLKTADKKQKARRSWKRVARAEGKKEIVNALFD